MGLTLARRNTMLDSGIPSTVYLALFNGDPTATGVEVTGGSYVRATCALGAATNGVKSNSAKVAFATATAAWGTVTHVGIFDAATAGNMIGSQALIGQVVVDVNGQPFFDIGQLSISLTSAA